MNFPCQGHFWLPGSPDRSVFGTLTFTRRSGAALSLADSLSANRDAVEADIVLGQTAGGDYLTLLHVIRTQAPLFPLTDRKSTRLNSSHLGISYAVFCLKKK